jgi:hypothetical protein
MEWDFPQIEHFDCAFQIQLFTVMRDPLTRAISNYRFSKLTGEIDEDVGFREAMNGSYRNVGPLARSANYYTRKLCAATSRELLDRTSLIRAQEVLGKFRSVIVLGRDNLTQELAKLGISAPVGAANQTAELSKAELPESLLAVSEEDQAWFERHNRLDIRLLQYLSTQGQNPQAPRNATRRPPPPGKDSPARAGSVITLQTSAKPAGASTDQQREEALRLALLEGMRAAFQRGDLTRVLENFEPLAGVKGLRSGIRVEAVSLAARTKVKLGEKQAAEALINGLQDRDYKNHRLCRYAAIACLELGDYRKATALTDKAATFVDQARLSGAASWVRPL